MLKIRAYFDMSEAISAFVKDFLPSIDYFV